jgi:hypothetical protein
MDRPVFDTPPGNFFPGNFCLEAGCATAFLADFCGFPSISRLHKPMNRLKRARDGRLMPLKTPANKQKCPMGLA